MSAVGHERHFGLFPAMSGLPPNSRHVNERWISSVWAKLRRTQPEQMSSRLPLKADTARHNPHVSRGQQRSL